MLLTITIEQTGCKAFDIQVPSKQRIKDTMEVLEENGFLKNKNWRQEQIRSVRRQRVLEPEKSYEENFIYTADCITLGGTQTNEEDKKETD